jgi:prepilin-type N-terminal cleavage/methylation domain-containing protein
MFAKFYNQKNKNCSQGFTLIEILVAIGIFAMLSSIFTVIYVTISKNQQRAKASQLLLNNSLYALELMARDIKNNELDYNFLVSGGDCNDVNNPKNCILFKRVDDSLGAFTQSGDALLYSVVQCATYPTDCTFSETAGAEILSASLNDVQLDYLRFLVEPIIEDPYLSQTVNQQPKVTIIMQTSYNSDKPSETISYTLQTTVSARIYKR